MRLTMAPVAVKSPIKGFNVLCAERKALLAEIRRADNTALKRYFDGQLRAVEARLAEIRKVGKPAPLRTRNGDVFATGKWEQM